MKIVIAPDSYKGSLSAKEVCDRIEAGIRRVIKDADIIKVPMADGGEGTVQSLVDFTNGKIIKTRVKDPLLRDIEGFYGILGDGETAVIEMAAASGLPLLKDNEKNPMKTSTYGTGQLIKNALDMGCRNLIIGIGGSATNDGGSGMVMALGGELLDKEGSTIGYGGGNLSKLEHINLDGFDKRIMECSIVAACDVSNPLCGPNGASFIFGPQKGADMSMIEELDKNLEHFAKVIKKDLGKDIMTKPGAGAAGGLGAGLMAFLNAELKKGIDIVIDVTDLDEKIKEVDIVITGEGRIDYQTQFGKTPFGVAQVAKKYGVPVIGICGAIGYGAEILYSKGFSSIFSIMDKPMSLEYAIENSGSLIENTAERVIRLALISL